MDSAVRIIYFIVGQAFASFLVSSSTYTILAQAVPFSLCNSTSEYYDHTSNSCRTCTNCTTLGLGILNECGPANDTICLCPAESEYYNTETRSCTRCTDCLNDKPQYETIKYCTNTSDAVCRPCQPSYYFVGTLGRCTLNCSACPGGSCTSLDMCLCPSCYLGPLCQLRDTISPGCRPKSPTTLPPNTARTPATDNQSFSTVNSALIAIGAVMCIVIFSACFVLLGVATTCRKSDENSSEVSSSSDRIAGTNHITIAGGRSRNAAVSPSLASLYMNNRYSPSPLQEYRTSLDLLKFSNSSLGSSGSWSMIKGSPKASRSNSAPLV